MYNIIKKYNIVEKIVLVEYTTIMCKEQYLF